MPRTKSSPTRKRSFGSSCAMWRKPLSLSKLEQKQGFGFRLVGLHGDGGIDPARATLLLQIFGQEVTLQDGHFLADPGMPHGMVFPEMLVRIDLHDKSRTPSNALPSSSRHFVRDALRCARS